MTKYYVWDADRRRPRYFKHVENAKAYAKRCADWAWGDRSWTVWRRDNNGLATAAFHVWRDGRVDEVALEEPF